MMVSLLFRPNPVRRRQMITVVALISFLGLGQVQGTIVVVSENSNSTVFTTEELGIESAIAYNLMGHLFSANPSNACETVQKPPNVTFPDGSPRTWILLATMMSGRSCSLSRRAKNAQFAGYSGIVIHRLGSNETEDVVPSFLGFDWIGVRVYTSIVGDNVGKILRDKYSYPKPFYIKFENEPQYSLSFLGNVTLIICMGILLLVIFVRGGCFIYSWLKDEIGSRVQERRRIRKTLLTEKQLKKLPVLLWTTGIPQENCSICLETFIPQDEIRVLPCSHVFHMICIDPWLLQERRKCPNCKRPVLFPNEHFSDSDTDSDSESTPLLGRFRENRRFLEMLTATHTQRLRSQDVQEENSITPSESPSSTATLESSDQAPKTDQMSTSGKAYQLNNDSTSTSLQSGNTNSTTNSLKTCNEEFQIGFSEIVTTKEDFQPVFVASRVSREHRVSTGNITDESISYYSCKDHDSDGAEEFFLSTKI